MARKKCPKCKRDTWSEKWESCSSCYFDRGVQKVVASSKDEDHEYVALGPAEIGNTVEPPSSGREFAAQITITRDMLVVGDPCPTCGKKVGRRTAKSGKP